MYQVQYSVGIIIKKGRLASILTSLVEVHKSALAQKGRVRLVRMAEHSPNSVRTISELYVLIVTNPLSRVEKLPQARDYLASYPWVSSRIVVVYHASLFHIP